MPVALCYARVRDAARVKAEMRCARYCVEGARQPAACRQQAQRAAQRARRSSGMQRCIVKQAQR